MDTFLQYGMAAGIQARYDSGLQDAPYDPTRIGVFVGSGIGGITNIEEAVHTIDSPGPRRISPFFVPASIINMISGNLSIHFNFQGPNLAISTACSTGTHTIGLAARMIAYGDADAMVAGGAEKASSPIGIGGFGAARALSTRNDDPQAASRPWDEGSRWFRPWRWQWGTRCLKSMRLRKNAALRIYAELVGFGMSGDAYHITSPSENGGWRCKLHAKRPTRRWN